MEEENELSFPSHLKSNSDEQNCIDSEQNENDCKKKTDEQKHDNIISDVESSEKKNEVVSDVEVQDEKSLKNEKKITEELSSLKNTEKIELVELIDELDDQKLREKLKNVSEHELLEMLKEIESTNFYLTKENEVYDFILNDDEILQGFSGRVEEVDKDMSAPESFELTLPTKCYFAKKKLEYTKKAFKQRNDDHTHEVQNLNFELTSLNKSLKDINETKEKFDKTIRIDGRHPVTKRIILQKVEKYFNDSIRNKMDLINRYKIQIQGDIIEKNKILSQIKAQEKRLAFLDTTEFQEAEFEYKKSCRELAMCKEQLGKCKAKFSFLLQKIAKLKKNLEKEESDIEKKKDSVVKLEHVKEVMLSEKVKNDEKVLQLNAEMRKIRLDPRRHNLPEVIDYAAAKRENVILMKSVDKWRKKVERHSAKKITTLGCLDKKE